MSNGGLNFALLNAYANRNKLLLNMDAYPINTASFFCEFDGPTCTGESSSKSSSKFNCLMNQFGELLYK